MLPYKVLFAQLTASFTINKESGCKPLTVQFTNTTTGAGANVVYSWNFGNGNTSALTNPGATYIEEKTYTVTLTATSGGNTSTATKQITVYKTPAVDFTATPTKGCIPLEVSFNANATAGDGTISKYAWDFGDGQTADGANLNTPKHTYTFAQLAPVSLTVTNSFGCFNSRTYGGLINIYQNVKADFSFNPIRTCKPTDPVSFVNKSQAPPGTRWLWEFGDGTTSEEQSPKHIFNKEGAFIIKLTATTLNGCTDVFQNVEPLLVADTKADFFLPAEACSQNMVKAVNLSPQPFLEANWWVNDLPVTNPVFYQDTTIYFSNAGTFSIKLEVDYGACKVQTVKQILIHKSPETPKPISTRTIPGCGTPATFQFTDTTNNSVAWVWYDIYRRDTLSKQKSFTNTFTDAQSSGIRVWVTNTFGCTTEGYTSAYFPVATVAIGTIGSYLIRCTKESIQFFGEPTPMEDSLISFKWDFGDGKGSSTLKSPLYTYDKGGLYSVSLEYETRSGCKGTTTTNINIVETPEIDFWAPEGTTICGSTPVLIQPTKYVPNYYDYFAGGKLYHASNNSGIANLVFDEEGKYDVVLYYSNGTCFDTIVKKDYFTVLPLFPEIQEIKNTCDGDRGTITIVDNSRKVEKWKWDFGDGTTREYTQKKDTIQHHYSKSGSFKVALETTTGTCSIEKENYVSVLLKQTPEISSPQPISCANTNTNIIIGPLEYNIRWGNYIPSYSIWEIQYKDSLNINFENTFPGYGFNPINGYQEFPFVNPSIGKFNFRYILRSGGYHCFDTTNFMNIELKGPKPNLEIFPDSLCISENLNIKDRSIAYHGTQIKSWNWLISDFSEILLDTTQFINGNLNYLLKNGRPGYLSVDLIVTDNEGCTNTEYKNISVSGPKSSFDISSKIVALNTTVLFTNTTDYSQDYNVLTKWILPNETVSFLENESFTFTEEGIFTIKLININNLTGCSDTATNTIDVRKVNAQFTHTISYVNNNGCPPAIVRFTSTATNAVRYGWNFGNGATGGNSTTVTHTYTQPGIYQVWHYSYDENNNVDSSFDFIEIKGPYALITANRLSACNNLQVTLSADVKNAESYVWDLGDGTINSNPQTQITHQYLTAGIYTPSLILEDAEGCKATSILPEKIIVDSLNGDFAYNPTKICAGTGVLFTGTPQSFSSAQLGDSIAYKWQVADGNNAIRGEEKTYQHAFLNQGSYAVTLTLESEYGCTKVISKTLSIEPPLNAAIAGASQICQGDTASFRASAAGTGVQFRWYIPGQPLLTTANTNAIQWNTAGTYNISVSADNGACIDSVVHTLTVNALPTIVFNPANPRVCLGDSTILTVQGNDTYMWQPQSSLQSTTNSTVRVWPVTDTWYTLKALSAAGCSSSDSIKVNVVQPFNLVVKSSYDACLGQPVNLSASGANRYQWIPATGLTNAQIANPITNTTVSRQYSVVGFDTFGCFTDTALVQVNMHPQPQVNAGADTAVLGGVAVQLLAQSSLTNVTWHWEPATYLSCANCANPVSRPLNDMLYTATATTSMGCSATDSMRVRVLCAADRLFIPTGFTPNGDGLNDRFGILGGGFSKIKHVRITNRWGNTVFERMNVIPTDPSATWNGNYADGNAATSGTYIYAIEVECVTGETFSYKGTITLLR